MHGDDFTFMGVQAELEKMRAKMEEWYEIKFRGIMGSGQGNISEIVILGRTLRWTNWGVEYEADSKHREILVEKMGLDDNANAVVGPAVREDQEEGDNGEEQELQGQACTDFRAAAARLNYLSQDRSDIQFATKEICREMAKPTSKVWRKVKRAVRYMIGAKRLVWHMDDREEEMALDVFADSDWAGCKSSRKSTSGGMIVVGGTVVKSWSRTQKTRALSSGEAEFYALTSAAAEALGMQAVAKDMGWDLKITVHTDSTAAKSMCSRRGLGKCRHMETKFLWLQQTVRRGKITVKKVDGPKNPADMLTKPQSRKEFADKLWEVGGELRD